MPEPGKILVADPLTYLSLPARGSSMCSCCGAQFGPRLFHTPGHSRQLCFQSNIHGLRITLVLSLSQLRTESLDCLPHATTSMTRCLRRSKARSNIQGIEASTESPYRTVEFRAHRWTPGILSFPNGGTRPTRSCLPIAMPSLTSHRDALHMHLEFQISRALNEWASPTKRHQDLHRLQEILSARLGLS